MRSGIIGGWVSRLALLAMIVGLVALGAVLLSADYKSIADYVWANVVQP